ncbi:MAG: hypothetical protein OK456_03540 [Thaumarchaeota archaeon]|nr:hypothetical protein [Nitrososphaerota archaeon]
MVVAEILVAVLAVFRFYDYWTTGFFVPDEYGYYYDGLHGSIYAGRWFFGDLNGLVFKLLGITNVDAYSYFLAFYIFFWASATFIFVFLLLREIEQDVTTRAVTILSSFVLVSFVLLSLGFLTEPMGLALAMGGVYFIVKFFKGGSDAEFLLYPLLAVLFFGAAGATREPYDAFLIGGVLLAAIGALSHFRKSKAPQAKYGGRRRHLLAICSILLFLVPAAIFYYEDSATSAQVSSLGPQIIQTVLTNPANQGTSSTETVTSTSTSTYISVTLNHTTTVTTTTVVSSVTTVEQPQPSYATHLITNTLVIFAGGILLGWGPLAFGIGLAGLLLVLRRAVFGRDLSYLFLLLITLIALGSYLIVSYIFGYDQSYFSFTNYSTIIRFSDTALPAFFLTAPIALGVIAKRKKGLVIYAAVIIIFLIAAVPVYQNYAASNIRYVGANPFAFGYHTDAVLIRNYVEQNLSGQKLTIIGVPYGWIFTPGVQDLSQLSVYDYTRDPVLPHLDSGNFTSMRLTTFYVLIYDASTIARDAPWLAPFINSTLQSGSISGSAYTVTGRSVVYDTSAFELLKVSLVWT